MKKKLANILAASIAMGEGLPNVKLPTQRGSFKSKPPRSMTPEEKEYYDKHKNLNGFYKSKLP